LEYNTETTPDGQILKGCAKWETVSVTVPQSFDVKVSDDAEGSSTMFFKGYTVPSCK
jgi:hypothetical protein